MMVLFIPVESYGLWDSSIGKHISVEDTNDRVSCVLLTQLVKAESPKK